jgi:hypothetical protein
MLKKDIRKALLEAKEKKETILVENKIVESRILMIFESRDKINNFNQLSKSEKRKVTNSLVQEIHYLGQNGLINEGFMDILKGLFGGLLGSVAETAAEPLVNSLLSAIGFKSNGFMKKFVISFLTSNPKDLMNAFSDCKLMTKLLTRSLIEGMVMMFQQDTEKGGYIYDFIRNELGKLIEDSSIGSSLENKFAGIVCDMFGKFTDKAQTVANKLNTPKETTPSIPSLPAPDKVKDSGVDGGFLKNLFGK